MDIDETSWDDEYILEIELDDIVIKKLHGI